MPRGGGGRVRRARGCVHGGRGRGRGHVHGRRGYGLWLGLRIRRRMHAARLTASLLFAQSLPRSLAFPRPPCPPVASHTVPGPGGIQKIAHGDAARAACASFDAAAAPFRARVDRVTRAFAARVAEAAGAPPPAASSRRRTGTSSTPSRTWWMAVSCLPRIRLVDGPGT